MKNFIKYGLLIGGTFLTVGVHAEPSHAYCAKHPSSKACHEKASVTHHKTKNNHAKQLHHTGGHHTLDHQSVISPIQKHKVLEPKVSEPTNKIAAQPQPVPEVNWQPRKQDKVATESTYQSESSSWKPYLGGYGGFNTWRNNESVQGVYGSGSPFPGVVVPGLSNSYAQSAFVTGVLLGATKAVHSKIVLGGEANLGYNWLPKKINATVQGSTYNYTTTQQMGPEFGLTGLAGYEFSPKVMAYVKLGYAMTQFSTKSEEANLTGPTGNFSKWTGGILSGLGVSYALNPLVNLRAEYQRVAYHAVNFQGVDQSNDPEHGQFYGSVSSQNSVSADRILFSAIYQF